MTELLVKEDPAYNTRSTTNAALDVNNGAEISKKSTYKRFKKLAQFLLERKASDG